MVDLPASKFSDRMVTLGLNNGQSNLVLSTCPLPLSHEIMQKASNYRSGAKVSAQGSCTNRDGELK